MNIEVLVMTVFILLHTLDQRLLPIQLLEAPLALIQLTNIDISHLKLMTIQLSCRVRGRETAYRCKCTCVSEMGETKKQLFV